MPLSLLQVTLTHERRRKCPQIEIKEFHATSVPNIRLLIVTTPQLGVDPTTRMVCADFRACSHAQGTPWSYRIFDLGAENGSLGASRLYLLRD